MHLRLTLSYLPNDNDPYPVIPNSETNFIYNIQYFIRKRKPSRKEEWLPPKPWWELISTPIPPMCCVATRDIIFGSLGHAHSAKWNGTGLAFPTDHNTTTEAIHWARMTAKEDTTTTTILIINHTDWTSQTIPLNKHPDIHTIVTIPPHSIQYHPTPEWPNTTNTPNPHSHPSSAYIIKQHLYQIQESH